MFNLKFIFKDVSILHLIKVNTTREYKLRFAPLNRLTSSSPQTTFS